MKRVVNIKEYRRNEFKKAMAQLARVGKSCLYGAPKESATLARKSKEQRKVGIANVEKKNPRTGFACGCITKARPKRWFAEKELDFSLAPSS